VGTGPHSLRVLLVAWGSGNWFIIAWALSLAMFMLSSWVVVVIVLWWGHGLVFCFVVMLCQLLHDWLPLSHIALLSIVVIVLQSSVCVSLMTMNDDQCRCSSFGCHVTIGDVAPDSDLKKQTGGRRM